MGGEPAADASSSASEWTHGVDEASGHYYWYNERTGESVWDEPQESSTDAGGHPVKPPPVDIPPPTPPKASKASKAAMSAGSGEPPHSSGKWSTADVPDHVDDAEFDSDTNDASASPASSSAGTERLFASRQSSPTAELVY